MIGCLCFKGRLLDRGTVNGLSIIRGGIGVLLGTQYLYFGDFLAGSLLWEEYKYIYYKYEPQIRQKKFIKYPRFVHDTE